MSAPTGEQFGLTGIWGTHRTEAIVTELAAGLRSLTVNGEHITEPFPAPPDALNSGLGLRWLQPDETWTLTWGIAMGDAND